MSGPDAAPDRIPTRSWLMLAASVLVATAAAGVTAGIPFLIPALHDDRGLSLTTAGLLVALPVVGTALTLIAWGAIVDRVGERIVLAIGSALGALSTLGAVLVSATLPTALFFLLAGAAAASANSASGRVVVGWFPAHRRGLAMGIRQMAQPLGAGITAITMPTIARDNGVSAALIVPTVLCALAALIAWTVIIDPPRPPAQAPESRDLLLNPYRASRYLARIHLASVFLVVPQVLMQSYLLVWLIIGHGWTPASAGIAVTMAQVAGALGRILVGAWSDRLGSRMRPLRSVALAGIVGAGTLTVAEGSGVPTSVSVVIAVLVTAISVADNGLAFTAVAEYAGPFWSGRALGAQNTAQFFAIAACTPIIAAIIEHTNYTVAFAVAPLMAAIALPIVPREDRARGEGSQL